MFDIAPSEFLILAVVALVFIGPKDLPKVMRVVGRWVGKARGMASHFRTGFDEMVRQAELEELEKKWKAENERIMREHPLAAPFDTLDATPVPEAAPVPLPLIDGTEGAPLAPPAEALPVVEADAAAPELPLPPGDASRRSLP